LRDELLVLAMATGLLADALLPITSLLSQSVLDIIISLGLFGEINGSRGLAKMWGGLRNILHRKRHDIALVRVTRLAKHRFIVEANNWVEFQ
jgi:hypothetical protein